MSLLVLAVVLHGKHLLGGQIRAEVDGAKTSSGIWSVRGIVVTALSPGPPSRCPVSERERGRKSERGRQRERGGGGRESECIIKLKETYGMKKQF